jgi:hypothetical protein
LIEGGETTIADNAPILFDTVINNTSTALTYDPITGEITITESGVYYVNWWLAIDGSTVSPTISYTIITSAGDSVTASSPILSENMSGNALLSITASLITPVTLQLINTTGNDTFIGSTAVQADLTIIHL